MYKRLHFINQNMAVTNTLKTSNPKKDYDSLISKWHFPSTFYLSLRWLLHVSLNHVDAIPQEYFSWA